MATRPAVLRQWFIVGDGIDRHVISTNIQRYLGNDATVRPGTGTGENEGKAGFWIRAYRTLTHAMEADLRADSAKWRQEQRSTGTRGSSSPTLSDVSGITVPDSYVEGFEGSETYLASIRAARRDGDSPVVDGSYGPPSSRDRLPAGRAPVDRISTDRLGPERMSADRMQADRMQSERMDVDPPPMAQADRRYLPDRRYEQDGRPFAPEGRGYTPDPRGYQPVDSRAYHQEPLAPSGYPRGVNPAVYSQDQRYPPGYPSQPLDGVPPGYARPGAYPVPLSSAYEPARAMTSSRTDSLQYAPGSYGPPPGQRGEQRDPRDQREMRDPRDSRDLRDVRDVRDPRDQRDPRDMRDPRDGRELRDGRYGGQPEYQTDPYAYPSPANTVTTMRDLRDRVEPIQSPGHSSYPAPTGHVDQYGRPVQYAPRQPERGPPPGSDPYAGRERGPPPSNADTHRSARRRIG